MAKVLELEIDETAQDRGSGKIEKDTWLLKLPIEICRKEGFAEGTMISLTIRDGAIQSSFIQPKPELKKISERLKRKNKQLYEELKRLGD